MSQPNQKKCFSYVIHALYLDAKQNIVHGLGPSNIGLVIFASTFEVDRAS